MRQAQSPISIGNARDWAPILRRYREPDHARSVLEVFITAVPFVLLWVLMWASLSLSYWPSLIIAVPAAGFLVRLFMIQHDCGHGAFFRHRWANDWLGRAIGVVTVTPYDQWRRSHAIHHASSGNLERRGIGDIDTLTVREYLGSSRWGRLRYRLYRHPLVMFGIGPADLSWWSTDCRSADKNVPGQPQRGGTAASLRAETAEGRPPHLRRPDRVRRCLSRRTQTKAGVPRTADYIRPATIVVRA